MDGLNLNGNPQMLPQILSFGEANVTLATIKHRVIWLFNFLTNQDTYMTCRENQAAVIHAISPFSIKLCQVEGVTQAITLQDKVGQLRDFSLRS